MGLMIPYCAETLAFLDVVVIKSYQHITAHIQARSVEQSRSLGTTARRRSELKPAESPGIVGDPMVEVPL